MLPSVTPKLAQCKSTFDMHSFRLHHNCKIDTARFEQGKRPPTSSRVAPRTKLSRDAWTHAPCWIKRERSSHVVERRIRRWKPSLGSFDCMVDRSMSTARRAFFGPAHTPTGAKWVPLIVRIMGDYGTSGTGAKADSPLTPLRRSSDSKHGRLPS